MPVTTLISAVLIGMAAGAVLILLGYALERRWLQAALAAYWLGFGLAFLVPAGAFVLAVIS